MRGRSASILRPVTSTAIRHSPFRKHLDHRLMCELPVYHIASLFMCGCHTLQAQTSMSTFARPRGRTKLAVLDLRRATAIGVRMSRMRCACIAWGSAAAGLRASASSQCSTPL
jgi:hypothetical protein